MTFKTVLTLLAIAAVGSAAGGCATINKIKGSGGKNKVIASQGERIPLIEANQKLEVSEALKGQTFYLPDAQPVAAWPQPGGTPDTWIENLAAGAKLQVAWRRKFGVGDSRKQYVTAPPVAADGKVFVMDADCNVSAIDANTGQRVWRAALPQKTKRDREAFGGGLTFADGKLYVTSGYRFVAALDAGTGKVVWRTNVDTPIHGAPIVMDHRVLAIDVDDQLSAYNEETGVQDWTYQALSEPARILAASSPAPAGDTAIAPFASGELVAIRAANGSEGWTATLSRTSRTNALSEIRDIAGRPVVYQGAVFAGSHSGVFAAVDLRTGDPQWTLPVSSITTPWPAGDVVYVVSQAGQVICASRGTGQVYWITELNQQTLATGKKKPKKNKKQRVQYFGPVLASGQLLVVSDKGLLISMDPHTGRVQRQLKIGEGSLMPPIAMNGKLYLVTTDASLVAIQ